MQLNDKTICLDLSNATSYKQKQTLIKLLTNNGAKVSFILNKNASLVVKNDKKDVESYKTRTAFKLGIPVVHVDYIHQLINNDYVDIKDYLISNKENMDNFKNGKISKGKAHNSN